MSILGNILNSLTSGSGDSSPKPCSNCPGDCPICPNACEECRPYKEKLIDILYDVEHLDEFRDKYEVVDPSAVTGEEACPYCGGNNPAGALACDYCGSALREGTAKIQVTSASQIPDPIQQAQDVIFERQALVERYSGSESSGLLEGLMDLVSGSSSSFGSRMSTDEIESTAAGYGVSVSDYLQGLDNGRYLTASAKEKQEKAAAVSSAIPLGTAAGVLGGAAAVRGSSMGTNRYNTVPPQHYAASRQPMPSMQQRPQHNGAPHGGAPRGGGRPAVQQSSRSGSGVSHSGSAQAGKAQSKIGQTGKVQSKTGQSRSSGGSHGGRR